MVELSLIKEHQVKGERSLPFKTGKKEDALERRQRSRPDGARKVNQSRRSLG